MHRMNRRTYGKRRPFRERFSNFSEALIAAVSLLVFGFLSIVSLVMTCHVDLGFSRDNNEHVSF
jgi:hypothetical protein